jgi:FkbM family methyltransferase
VSLYGGSAAWKQSATPTLVSTGALPSLPPDFLSHAMEVSAAAASYHAWLQIVSLFAFFALLYSYAPPAPARLKPSSAALTTSEMACSWQPLSAPELELCAPTFMRPGANTLAYHQDPDFLAVCHGPSDYISSGCVNDRNFFEWSTSRWMGSVLTAARAARPGGETCAGDSVVWYLDVGANLGLHALHQAALGVPTLALEMMLGTAARLACAKLVNRFEHLVVRRVGVGATRTHACASNPTEGNVGGTQLRVPAAAECVGAQASVDVLPLDDILDEFNAGLGRAPPHLLPPPALLKIDCEGCEWGVVSGLARHFAAGWRPGVIVLETFNKLLRSNVGERADDPLDGAQQVKVSSATMLLRFIPLGYRVWTGDMREELTQRLRGALALGEDEKDKLGLELDAASVARECPLVVLALPEVPQPPVPVNGCKEFRRA